MVFCRRMKSTVETMESDTGIARSAWSVFAELVKARLTALVLLTTLSGFYLASSGSMDWLLLFNTLFGTGLLACGASVLNQYMERDLDALMPRTAKRPLPSGWMMPEKAFWFGVTLSLVGVLYLMWKVNLLTCVLGALTLAFTSVSTLPQASDGLEHAGRCHPEFSFLLNGVGRLQQVLLGQGAGRCF